MREIKFRAWNGKEMVDTGMYHSCIPNTTKMWDGEEYLELMQYTGLKDKNGTEIYEGDIIGYWAKASWIVAYVEYQWRLVGPEGWNGSFAFSPSALKGKKVIGNIYENPELLK